MARKNYFYITGIVFTAIAFIHLTRALSGWPILLGGIEIPVWVSWAVVVIAGYLAVQGFNLHKK